MHLSIESLRESGSFTGAPVERQIEWSQGGETLTATVFVRPLSYQSAVADVTAAASKLDPIAARIASSICGEDGKPIFTVADITGDADPDRGALNGNLTMALMTAIGEVNNLGKTQS